MKSIRKPIYYLLLLLNYSLINCQFQLSLFSKLNKKNKGQNLTISPISIFQALSLAATGANGLTLEEMLNVLDINDIVELNKINKQIYLTLNEISSIEMANAILSKFNPLEKFTKSAKDNYSVEIKPLKNALQVNEWCNIKTHGKIQKIIESLNPNVAMIILNAIYFKSQWVNEFNKEKTSKKPFYNFGNKNNVKQVDTMTQKEKFLYYENSKLQIIRMPYKDDDMSAIIILPSIKVNINDFIEELNKKPESINNIIKKMKYEKVKIELPKFELSCTVDNIKKTLQEMGMNYAFSLKADFSGIRTQNDLYIDDVLHKAYLKVDESGTEAAAVTAVVMNFKSAPPKKTKVYEMKVNRPFLFIIRNEKLMTNFDFVFISKIEEIN